MIKVSGDLVISAEEIEFSAIRAQGSGGQNVNKVSSALHLRFDVRRSSLPSRYKERLLALRDRRVNKDGVIIIKAQRFRTLEKNRADALARLQEMIDGVTVEQKRRRPTKPSLGAKKRRLESKTRRGKTKSMRGRVGDDGH